MSDARNDIGGAAESGSDTPSIADDSSLFDRLPLTRRQALVLALVAVVIGVAVLAGRREASRSAPAGATDQTGTAGTADETADDASDDGEEIEIESSQSDPLAADEQVAEEFRNRGRISDDDTEE